MLSAWVFVQKHPFNTYIFPQPALLIAVRLGLQVFFSLSPFLSHSFPFFQLGGDCDGASGGKEINRLFGLFFLPRAALTAP